MRVWWLILVSTALSSGCASTLLRNRMNDQVSTLPDLYYQQVLDNLAAIQAHPARLPYFANSLVGRIGVQRTTLAYQQFHWERITSGATAFLGRYLFDEHVAQVQGSQLLLGEWLPRTTDNPDKLLLMPCAYHKAIGLTSAPEEEFLRGSTTTTLAACRRAFLVDLLDMGQVTGEVRGHPQSGRGVGRG